MNGPCANPNLYLSFRFFYFVVCSGHLPEEHGESVLAGQGAVSGRSRLPLQHPRKRPAADQGSHCGGHHPLSRVHTVYTRGVKLKHTVGPISQQIKLVFFMFLLP